MTTSKHLFRADLPGLIRHLFLVESRRDDIAEPTERWSDEHIRDTRCPGCHRWREEVPWKAVDVELERLPQSPLVTSGLFQVADAGFAALIARHARGVAVGEVRLRGDLGPLPDWRTIKCHRDQWLETDRGRFSVHNQCHRCGYVRAAVGWAHPVVVERSLDGSLAYLNSCDSLFVEPEFVSREVLDAAYPGLRFIPVPVVAEPLDNDVLPGDPLWTGTFTPRPFKERYFKIREGAALTENLPREKGGLWL